MTTIQYNINSKHVVYETVESETIVMNLINGNYFSFDGVGPIIWELLTQGLPVSQIIQIICDRFGLSEGEILKSVSEFVAQLEKNELIFKSEDEAIKQVSISNDEISKILDLAGKSYITPEIHKYTDMQDILLLDPIHDVNIKGWPEPKF
jgi:hypothetical protein